MNTRGTIDGPDGRVVSVPMLDALRAMPLIERIQIAYLLCLLLAVFHGAGPTRGAALAWLSFDLALFCGAVAVFRGDAPTRASTRAYRVAACMPVLSTFAQLHLILPAATRWRRLDDRLLGFDQRWLRYEPSVAWDAHVTPAATEWLSFFYLSYFALLAVHLFPIVFVERRRHIVAEFTLGIATLYCAGQLLYVVVPAYGPYVHLAGTFSRDLDGPTWYPLMRRIVASGGARADVFPSLHTAAPTFLALFSFHHRRERPFRYTWPVVAFVASQIIVATMYLRWHYLIDVLAGLTLAASVFVFSSLRPNTRHQPGNTVNTSRSLTSSPPLSRRFAVAPLLFAVGLGAAACGSSTENVPAAGASLATPAGFESAWANAECERIARCGELPGEDDLTAGNLRNRAACVSLFGASIRRDGLAASVARGVMRYDAAAAQRCIDELRASCRIPGMPDINACRDVFVGTLAVGAACTSGASCLPGNTCDGTGSCGGTCRPAIARGAPCGTSEAGFVCAQPAGGVGYCGSFDRTGFESVCNHYRAGAPAAQGMPCGVTPGPSDSEFVVTPCAIGLACAQTAGGGVCQALAAAGAPCGTEGIACEAGSICAQVGRGFTCQAAAVRTSAGASCGAREMALCDPATLFCTDDSRGECAVAGAGRAGASCTPGEFGSIACAPGLACAADTRTCVPLAADGQPCERDAECSSGACCGSPGTCQSG